MTTTFKTARGRDLTVEIVTGDDECASPNRPVIRFLDALGQPTGFSYFADTLAGRDEWGHGWSGGLLLHGGSGESLSAEEHARLIAYACAVCDLAEAGRIDR